MFTFNDIINIGSNQEEFAKLSREDKQLVITILREYQETGTSKTLTDIWSEDYEEIPVPIDEFICNPYYLGKSTGNGESIYPYWRKTYRKIFDPALAYEEIIFTGAIGVGKTKTADVCLAYKLYELMCLKNPQKYFKMIEGEEISIFFLNINLDLAEGVGFNTLHKMVIASDWFKERGSITGRKKLRYNPPNNITIKFGSKSDHALGQQCYCLSGDTEVFTTNGIFQIKDLCGKEFKTYCMSDTGEVVESETTTVMQTAETNDYYEIELEDGTVIKCTPEHRFMLKDGSYKMAKDLTEEDDLMECTPYGYVYITTNLINGMKYIGQHGGIFNPRYKGSWSNLKKAFVEFGRENFVSELICYCYTYEELNKMERFYIDKYNAIESNNFYNMLNTVMTWDTRSKENRYKICTNLGKHLSQNTKNKLRESKLSINSKKGKSFWINNGKEERLINSKEYKNMYPTYSIGRLDDVVYMFLNEDTIRVHRSDVDDYIKKGYLIGKSKNILDNISKSLQKEYWIYNDVKMCSARQLTEYLKNNGYPDIVKSTVVNIANGKYVKKYEDLCGNIYRVKMEK